MLLKHVFVRFYRSFNFDYLRKFMGSDGPRWPWEQIDDQWYPFVRIAIEPRITTVVGANESGKSQLLSALERGLTGEGVSRSDFCRYSSLFAVQKGKMRWPDFGFEWGEFTTDDRAKLLEALELDDALEPASIVRIFTFRIQNQPLVVYLEAGGAIVKCAVRSESLLHALLPRVFRLQEDVGLPESVAIRYLAGDPDATGFETLSRAERHAVFSGIRQSHRGWFKSRETVTANVDAIVGAFEQFTRSDGSRGDQHVDSKGQRASARLAHDLIRKIADVDAEALHELERALAAGNDAYANGLVDQINKELEKRLNFPRVWVQDRNFQLRVSLRENDLVFTIRDRTDTEYAFGERSSGLRYFLSYYIQYLAHRRDPNRPEILLMDEPDAFLSSQGQQDLLRVFDLFTDPLIGTHPLQLIYVTHSPFLIDRNHGERVRVVEKGVGDEGTRVVGDVARNHYEPLRSAFGGHVGESTFIGNCNLVVEGQSDQILLAGLASHLRRMAVADVELIDLNHLTLVPAGGASHVPYIVFLAVGRDTEKPAVIVLLDSDTAGSEARKQLERGGPRRKQLLRSNYVVQLGELTNEAGSTGAPIQEMEDLFPTFIAARAARRYLETVWGTEPEQIVAVTQEAIDAELKLTGNSFDAVQRVVERANPAIPISKVAYARALVEVIAGLRGEQELDAVAKGAIERTEEIFRVLFRRLQTMQRAAMRERTKERLTQKVDRLRNAFLADFSSTFRNEDVHILLEEMSLELDDSEEGEQLGKLLRELRRDFRIDDDPSALVENPRALRDRLSKLRYVALAASQERTLQEIVAARRPEPVAGK